MNVLQNYFTEKKLLIAGFGIIVVYFFPYFFLGENANILIHDNLDSNIAWVKILQDNGLFFASPETNVSQVFNGLKLFSIYPYYDLSLVFFKLFGIYWGYVANKILMSLIGYLGMYLLLKRHFFNSNYSPIVLVGVSLCFGLLPFWSFMGTVAMLPLGLFAFLNFRRNVSKISDWIILFFFAFYTSLILSGLFLLIIVSCILLHDSIKNRKVNWPLFKSLSFVSLTFVVAQLPIFYSFLYGEVTNRVEFSPQATNFSRSVDLSFKLFSQGQYHAHSLHQYIWLPSLLLILVFGESSKKVKLIVLFIALTSIYYGFLNFNYFQSYVQDLFKVFPVQLQRFHFLHPLFWYVLFGIAINALSSKIKFGTYITTGLIIFQLVYIVGHHEISVNKLKPSFKSFYAEETFEEVKKLIGEPVESYRVISVGMHPAIAQYNGFYTLDGYFPNFPLNHKEKFRNVIKPEIERDSVVNNYFENFGSRCYAFSSETKLNFVKNDFEEIDTLNYNFNHFREMGGRYIICPTTINLKNNPELKKVGSVSKPNTYWTIYVYEVI